jgi:hypothetical protein
LPCCHDTVALVLAAHANNGHKIIIDSSSSSGSHHALAAAYTAPLTHAQLEHTQHARLTQLLDLAINGSPVLQHCVQLRLEDDGRQALRCSSHGGSSRHRSRSST